MSTELNSLLTRIGFFAVLIAIFFWLYQDPKRDESGSIIASGNIDPLELFVGDCYMESFALEEGEFRDLRSVDAVPCSALHNNEVIAAFDRLSWSKEDMLSNDAFEKMSETCIAELITYTNFLNESDDVETFDATYGMNILFTRIGISEEPDPDQQFSCVMSNVSELTKTSIKNYFR